MKQARTSNLQQLRGPLLAHWQSLGERDRLVLRLAFTGLALLLVWLLALQPAMRVLRETPAQLDAAELSLQQMQRLALEANELRAVPAVSAEQSMQALQAASQYLGPQASLTIQADRAVLSFSGITGAALQAWLIEVRSAARARPIQAQVQRGPKGYDGSITLVLAGAAR